MPGAETPAQPEFYFSLPRLLMKLGGGNARRTEKSWAEGNLVGFAVFGISYLFLARLLPGDHAWWAHLVILAPLGFATFLFWLVALYLNSVVVKLLRACGFMDGVSDSRAQVVLVAVLTTIFAFCLMRAGSWNRVMGTIWMIGVVLNFIAAALLAGRHADDPVA